MNLDKQQTEKTQREYLIQILHSVNASRQAQERSETLTHDIAENISALTQEREEFRRKLADLLDKVKISGNAIRTLLGRSNKRLTCQIFGMLLYLSCFYMFFLR
jgi:hypothetical protein